jgi:hypothetical protein
MLMYDELVRMREWLWHPLRPPFIIFDEEPMKQRKYLRMNNSLAKNFRLGTPKLK